MANMRLLIILLMTLLVEIAPFPIILHPFKPPLFLLFVFYTQFFLSPYFQCVYFIFLGICVDVLLGDVVLGQQSFALLMTTLFTMGKNRRFSFIPPLNKR